MFWNIYMDWKHVFILLNTELYHELSQCVTALNIQTDLPDVEPNFYPNKQVTQQKLSPSRPNDTHIRQ